MKKISLAVLCFCSFVFNAASQETMPPKSSGQTSFYAELGGPGILFSANIDRRFGPTHLGLGGRAGLGFISGNFEDYDPINYNYRQRSIITVPVQLNYIFGKESSVHTFEVGLGATFLGRKVGILDFPYDEPTQIFGTASFMYRRQPKNGGFSWRGGITPLIARGYIQPFAGFSVGYNF
ncbi:MAG: hypothetical protein V4725_08755 [Bacteroidota bacterium]|nr:hypothetical protein [Ferruginibacter sp.]